MLAFGQSPEDSPYGTVGLVNVIGAACIIPLTVMFAPVGAGLAQRLDAAKLKKVLAVVLIFTGVKMLYQVLG